MSVLDTQVGGDHYKKLGDYQPWQVLQKWLTPEEFRGYMKGTAIAYLAREQDKGGFQDIEKGMHTLQGFLELAVNTKVPEKVGAVDWEAEISAPGNWRPYMPESPHPGHRFIKVLFIVDGEIRVCSGFADEMAFHHCIAYRFIDMPTNGQK